MESLKGLLLVASRELRDPNFQQAVVLMVQHGDDGALGLILNRPTKVPVKQVWSQVSESPFEYDSHLYLGGPCEGPLMVLHADPVRSEIEVMPGVYFSGGSENIQQLIAEHADPVRFFAGYAGWGASQLENEMDEGSWLTCPATPDDVFASDDGLWHAVMRRLADSQLVSALGIRHVPNDPRMN